MQKVFDVTGQEIKVGQKVVYSINDSWSIGLVKNIVEKDYRKICTHLHVEIDKVQFSNNPKKSKASIMFGEKLLVVKDFSFLGTFGEKLEEVLNTK